MAQIPNPTQSNLREPTAFNSIHTYFSLIGFYVLAVMWGIRNIYQTEQSPIDLLLPIGFAFCLGLWALVDARQRRYRIPMLAKPLFILAAGIVVPGYVIWSRGWRGLGWVVLHAFLWLLLATIALHVGGIVIYGEAWLQALGV